MEFRLVEKSKKTLVKVSVKELEDKSNVIFLRLKGFDINNPVKENNKYKYFEVDGDIINTKHPRF